MGRASRKTATAAGDRREHWTDTHPDRHLWSPGRLAQARTQTQEEYEALYGRGEPLRPEGDLLLIPELDFAREYRNGTLDLSDGAVERLARRRQESMTWPLPGQSPLQGDIGAELLRRLKDSTIPPEAASVLGAALEQSDNMDRLWESLLRSRQEWLRSSPWERDWSQDDTYLYDKLLPALYSSPEEVAERESEAWIEALVTSKRVEERYGSARDHHLALAGEVEKIDREAAGRLRSRTENWHEELGQHIGQENGDHGYVSFIEIPNQVSREEAADFEEAALEASRAGLVHLVEKQLLLAGLQETGLEGGAADRYLLHGGTTEDALARSGKESEALIRDLGLFSPQKIREIESLIKNERYRNEGMYDRLSRSEREEMLYEKIAAGMRAACEEYIETFVERQQTGASPTISNLLFRALQREFA